MALQLKCLKPMTILFISKGLAKVSFLSERFGLNKKSHPEEWL